MNVLILTQRSTSYEVASKPTRNGFVHPIRDANVRLKERVSTLLLWRKPMAKVTYRGVEYDTEEYNAMVLEEATKRERHDLMYRGIKVRSKASPCS